jgi:hypothetical protein
MLRTALKIAGGPLLIAVVGAALWWTSTAFTSFAVGLALD